jgi:hypothetical protein
MIIFLLKKNSEMLQYLKSLEHKSLMAADYVACIPSVKGDLPHLQLCLPTQYGIDPFKGSKYNWLYSPENMTRKQKRRFQVLRDSALKIARAWAIKELAMSLWHCVSKTRQSKLILSFFIFGL